MIEKLKKIELEITSDCNAACPGCARTQNKGKYEVTQFNLEDIMRIFPSSNYIKQKVFKLSGVLGDPMTHPQIVEITEYFLKNGGCVEISTNTGVGTEEMWIELGKLNGQYKQNLRMMACIDGHRETNHIYRVNTKFSVIERNLNAYSMHSDKSTKNNNKWVFIVFDHNEHELEAAKNHAEKIGFKFFTRTGMKNSYNDWIVQLGKKNNQEKKVITTSGNKEHARREEVYRLDKIIAENKVDYSIIKTICCKYVHEGEIFINYNLQMWPCCFLADSAILNKENILDKFKEYGNEWNNLKIHSIEEVMNHPYYQTVLEESWNPTHSKHLKRCIKTCASNKAYQNVFVA